MSVEGIAYSEQVRPPRYVQKARDKEFGDRDIRYEYKEVQKSEPCLGGALYSHGVQAMRGRGWEVCEEDPMVTGHELKVIMRRPLDHPAALRERVKKARGRRERTVGTIASGQELREGVTVYEDQISLSAALGIGPDGEYAPPGGDVRKGTTEGASEGLEDHPAVQRAVQAAEQKMGSLDLADLD